MSLHTDLPIYKKGRELVQLAFNVQQQMPRSFKLARNPDQLERLAA